jgi:hypothetical protein
VANGALRELDGESALATAGALMRGATRAGCRHCSERELLLARITRA